MSTWAQIVQHPEQRIQSFVSSSNDPFLNLSIEHLLLTKSPADSVVLFLYSNRPSIIIGRNQNPWVEVNLDLLVRKQKPTKIDLIRRISGGGTVFHDEGNMNWTVICPPQDFTRDKHAEMVVKALRGLGVERARVNERHDIVLDQGTDRKDVDQGDLHTSPFLSNTPLKVSGSAYKLTRTRALHHGTCLLNSPNLNIIPNYLHSPAKPYVEAKGVGSVSSPVGNIGLQPQDFVQAVQDVFQRDYNKATPQRVGSDFLEIQAVRDMVEQLKVRFLIGYCSLLIPTVTGVDVLSNTAVYRSTYRKRTKVTIQSR